MTKISRKGNTLLCRLLKTKSVVLAVCFFFFLFHQHTLAGWYRHWFSFYIIIRSISFVCLLLEEAKEEMMLSSCPTSKCTYPSSRCSPLQDWLPPSKAAVDDAVSLFCPYCCCSCWWLTHLSSSFSYPSPLLLLSSCCCSCCCYSFSGVAHVAR